ncbi:MAG: flagellar protein FlgN [Desulfuromonadaceae bacterium]|nr:flagellar protein FlgN [Desulfuromonadaceae bacterium]
MKRLITALELQLSMLEELYSLLRQETSELSDIHLAAMADITMRKENVSSRIESHTKTLLTEIEQAVSREGMPPKTSLGELAARSSSKGNCDLLNLHTKLNDAARRVKQLLALNKEIAERFAASIGSSLELLSRVINQSNVYGASGGYQQRPTGSVIINREA